MYIVLFEVCFLSAFYFPDSNPYSIIMETLDNGSGSMVQDMIMQRRRQGYAPLTAIGVPYYSFTIPWSWVVPFGVKGSPINQQALDHYDDLINACLEYGIKRKSLFPPISPCMTPRLTSELPDSNRNTCARRQPYVRLLCLHKLSRRLSLRLQTSDDSVCLTCTILGHLQRAKHPIWPHVLNRE